MNNRFFKIAKIYKYALDNFLLQNTKDIQLALIAAGYSLPRYGADGFVGSETFNAILQFKRDNNLPQTKDMSEYEYKILKNISKEKEVIRDDIRLEDKKDYIKPSEYVLLFGDSQMQGGIGTVLQAKYGGKRLSKPGSNPSYWYSNYELEMELKKKPSKVIVHLGGNGTNGAEDLIKKIKLITPNSELIWYGAPPATLKENSPYSQVRTISSLIKFNENRNNMNNKIEGLLTSSGLNFDFINPFYDIFSIDDSKIPYQCTKCDGIHVPSSIAQQYYA
jgi:peptidoglycan hydrolase-like protein with peptidoglycan-binding domain